jgi:hypothetical protein
MEHLEGVTSYVKSDHILNLLEEVEGKLPEDKAKMLAVIDTYFALGHEQRLVYRLGRRAGVYRSTDDLKDELAYYRFKKLLQEMEAKEPGSAERQLSLLLDHYI